MFSNNLFEPGKSKIERKFLQSTVKQNQRFDKRKSHEFRNVEIYFGAEWGKLTLQLGETKVLARVTCELITPRLGRPSEGTLFLHVDVNGIAFLNEVQATHDQRLLALNSLVDRVFRASSAVDMESLCVVGEKYVWAIRVDVRVLNNDGNLNDAVVLAALAALMHFRRPEVTYHEGELCIYSERERELVPLIFLHYPTNVTFCAYSSTPYPFVDPTLVEENASNTTISISFNTYNELCSIIVGGTVPTKPHVIMQCAQQASRRCKNLVKFIRMALAEDATRRAKKQSIHLNDQWLRTEAILSFQQMMHDEEEIELPNPLLSIKSPTVETPTKQVKEEPQEQREEDIISVAQDDETWMPLGDVGEGTNKKKSSGGANPEGNNKLTPSHNKGKDKEKNSKKRKNRQTKSDSEEETLMTL